METILLALLLIAWCTLHSGLIALSVTDLMQAHLGRGYRYFRLVYNLIAIVTLLPIYYYYRTIDSVVLFQWQGGWQFVRLFLGLLALALFAGGMRAYDLPSFFGIRQAKDGARSATLSRDEGLDTTGALGVVRHPWYLGGILLLWSYRSEYTMTAITVSGILSCYLILGSLLEERKLLIRFGGEYRRYQQQVSMLMPFKRMKKVLNVVRNS